ncbi:MAG: HAMP domain-containing histidine kinase [Polyangiaceae bacterium]|nr:HAMP domain-containing histidine kinase [Polyangiaceae bacterium]
MNTKGEGADVKERLADIGEIAAEIAHELRSILQIISTSTYLARRDPAKSEPQLAKIERSVHIAHAIVDDLMTLARGEPIHTEPILLAEVLVAAREHLPPSGGDFTDVLPSPIVRVRAHQGLLTRLFHILYENAIGASVPRTPNIVTRAVFERDSVRITVTDDGPGVPDEVAKKLFEPLVSHGKAGTGLGLALARRIAAAHDGAIALIPNAPTYQSGATFCIELPRTPGETLA